MLGLLRVRVEWDEISNVKEIWERVKQAVVDSIREVCNSVMVERKTPWCMWLNDAVKGEAEKKGSWKEVLKVRNRTKKDV